MRESRVSGSTPRAPRVRRVANRADAEVLYDRVLEAIGVRSDIAERRMFGARAIIVDGKLCCSVKGRRIMVRIDPELHVASLKKPGVRPLTMNGHTYPGWLIVRDAVSLTKRQLGHWIDLALEYNPRAPASKRRSRARRKRPLF